MLMGFFYIDGILLCNINRITLHHYVNGMMLIMLIGFHYINGIPLIYQNSFNIMDFC